MFEPIRKYIKKEKNPPYKRSLLEINTDDLYFLRELQGRGMFPSGYAEDPQITKVNEGEVQKILEVSERNGLLFYPISAQFHMGYEVLTQMRVPEGKEEMILSTIADNTPPAINLDAFRKHLVWTERLFSCMEEVLPEMYRKEAGFNKLAEYFNGENNLALAEKLNIKWYKTYKQHKY